MDRHKKGEKKLSQLIETKPADKANTLGPIAPNNLKGLTGSVAIAAQAEAAKIAAKVLCARAVPRDLQQIKEHLLGYEYQDGNGNILRAPGKCDEVIFAEEAIYAKPTGGSVVEGLGHNFAKYLYQIWGNIDFQSHEHTKDMELKQTQIEVRIWDIEKNTTHTESVVVLHMKAGTQRYVDSTDDIRQEVNRQKSILERNALFDCFPKDLVQLCEERIFQTLDKAASLALKDPIKTIKSYAGVFEVNEGQVMSYLGISKLDQLKAAHVRRMSALKNALAAGETKKEKVFGSGLITTEALKTEEEAEQQKKEQEKVKAAKPQKKEEKKEEKKENVSSSASISPESQTPGPSSESRTESEQSLPAEAAKEESKPKQKEVTALTTTEELPEDEF